MFSEFARQSSSFSMWFLDIDEKMYYFAGNSRQGQWHHHSRSWDYKGSQSCRCS